MSSVNKLLVYKGEWGLPSIDVDCIRAMCLAKFYDIPIEINTDGNPFYSKSGVMPYMDCDNAKIYGYRHIATYIEKESMKKHFSNLEMKSLTWSYGVYLFNNLEPYYQYTLFGNPKNVDEARALYAKRTRFPFNFYYPGKSLKRADDSMKVFGNFSTYDGVEEHATEQIVLNAHKCINMLSEKLAVQKWFFGNEPTDFDAQVYAYLSILFNISLPNNPLQAHIRECPNLVKFIERITKKYFEKEGFCSKKQIKVTNANNTTILTSSEQEFAATKTKTQILFAVGSLCAMAFYAAWLGLVQITKEYDSYEYDDEYINDSES